MAIPESVSIHRRFTFVSKPAPQSWSSQNYEDYDQYHFRYLALGCHTKKDDSFFKRCCHPWNKSLSIEKIPVECQLDADSTLNAYKYISQSLSDQKSSQNTDGKPVHINEDSIQVMLPECGRSPSEPPSEDQIEEIHSAQKSINDLSKSIKDNSTSPTPALSLQNPTAKTEEASKAEAVRQAAIKSKAESDAKAEAEKKAAIKSKAESDAKAEAEKQAANSHPTDNSSNQNHSQSLFSSIANIFGNDGDAKGTFFFQEGAAGACGNSNSDDVPLVALPTALYDNGKHCGKNVLVENTANGKTVVARVQDMCPGCPSSHSLDLSTGAYDAIGERDTGVLPIKWGFLGN